jgi:carbon starvation protein CstA
VLAILGVVAAPITTGDTALRSARLIAADFMRYDQKTVVRRLIVSIPIFLVTFIIMQVNFDVLWRYFAWCNQTLAVFTLWAVTVYLARHGKFFWITMIPAMFMTCVCTTYILFANEGFGLDYNLSVMVSIIVAALLGASFLRHVYSHRGESVVQN